VLAFTVVHAPAAQEVLRLDQDTTRAEWDQRGRLAYTTGGSLFVMTGAWPEVTTQRIAELNSGRPHGGNYSRVGTAVVTAAFALVDDPCITEITLVPRAPVRRLRVEEIWGGAMPPTRARSRRSRGVAFALLSCLLIGLAPASHVPTARPSPQRATVALNDGPWPLFHQDASHRGQAVTAGPQRVSVSAWTVPVGAAYYASPVVASDGTIYIDGRHRVGVTFGKPHYALGIDGNPAWGSKRSRDRKLLHLPGNRINDADAIHLLIGESDPSIRRRLPLRRSTQVFARLSKRYSVHP
jgi:hypothetical protein